MGNKINLKQRMAMAVPFAHLLGIGASAAADDGTDGDDDKKQRPDESDEDYAKRMEDEDKKQREDESDEDYAKRMADDGDDADAEDDDKKEQAARVSERARCAAIFMAPAAAARPDVAAHLAFSTDMSSAEAIKMLTTFANGGAGSSRSLGNRMAAVKVPNPGANDAGTPAGAAGGGAAAGAAGASAGLVQRILAAGKAARGEQ